MAYKEILNLTLQITNPSALAFLKKTHHLQTRLELGGVDYNKLIKLKQDGLNIKTKLDLTGKGFDQLMKWQREGIVIKTRLEGLPSLSGGSRSSGGSSGGRPLSQKELNDLQVAEYDQFYANKDRKAGGSAMERERRAKTDRLMQAYVQAQELLVKNTQKAAKAAEKLANANQKAADMLIKDLSKTVQGPQTIRSFTRGFENSSLIQGPGDPEMRARAERVRQQELRLQAQERQAEEQRIINFYRRLKRESIEGARNANISRNAPIKAFRAGDVERRAIEEFDRSAIFSNQEELLRDIAFRRNTTPGRLQSALAVPQAGQGIGPININTRRRFFDPSRLQEPGVAKEVAFAGLFGGIPGLVGAGTGGSISPGSGALIGGAVAQVAVEATIRAFESIYEVLKRTAEAGLLFNESILGISATLQATTRVVGSNGKELPFGDQLNFQQGKAREIQVAARKKLLRIGIGGEKEATLVQAIVAGAAQRGIQLTADEAATLAERIGGAVQAQRPELLNNASQLRRDVEDLLSGLPNRTVLGSLVKGFAPGIGTATSGQGLIQASNGLAQFPATLAGSKNNPVVAFAQLNTAIDNLNTTVGDKLVTALIPGLNALTAALADPKLTEGFSNLVTLIGTLTSEVAKRALTPRANALDLGNSETSTDARRSLLLKLSQSPQTAIATIFGDIAERAKDAIFEKLFPEKKPKGESETRANISLENINKELGLKQDDINSQIAGKGSTKGKEFLVGALSLFREEEERQVLEGIDNDFKEALKNPLNFGKEDEVRKVREERIKAAKRATLQGRIGDALARQDLITDQTAEGEARSDTSSTGGQVLLQQFLREQRGKQASAILDEIAGRKQDKAEKEVKLNEALLKSDASGLFGGKEKLSNEALRRLQQDIVDQAGAIEAAETKLIKLRKEETGAIDATAAALQIQINKEKNIFNSGTFAGQRGLLNSENDSIRVERNRIDEQRRTKLAEARTVKDPKRAKELEAELNDLGIDTQIVDNRTEILGQNTNRLNLDRDSARLSFKRLGQNDAIARAEFGLNQRSQDLQGRSLDLQGKSLALTFQDLIDKSKELAGNFNAASRALEDFGKDEKLRKLGRQGQVLAAVDNAIGKGASEAELATLLNGTGVSLYDATDPDARARFEKSLAIEQLSSISNKNQLDRTGQEDSETQIKLGNAVNQASRAGARLDIEFEGLKIDKERLNIAKQQLEIDKKKLMIAEQDRQFNLLKQLIELAQQFKGDKSPEGQEIQEAGEEAKKRIGPLIKKILKGDLPDGSGGGDNGGDSGSGGAGGSGGGRPQTAPPVSRGGSGGGGSGPATVAPGITLPISPAKGDVSSVKKLMEGTPKELAAKKDKLMAAIKQGGPAGEIARKQLSRLLGNSAFTKYLHDQPGGEASLSEAVNAATTYNDELDRDLYPFADPNKPLVTLKGRTSTEELDFLKGEGFTETGETYADGTPYLQGPGGRTGTKIDPLTGKKVRDDEIMDQFQGAADKYKRLNGYGALQRNYEQLIFDGYSEEDARKISEGDKVWKGVGSLNFTHDEMGNVKIDSTRGMPTGPEDYKKLFGQQGEEGMTPAMVFPGVDIPMFPAGADVSLRAYNNAKRNRAYKEIKSPYATEGGLTRDPFLQGQLDAASGYMSPNEYEDPAGALKRLKATDSLGSTRDNVFSREMPSESPVDALNRKLKPGFASTAVAAAAGEGHKEMVGKVSSLENGLKSLVQAAIEAPGKTGAAFQSALQSSFGN